METPVTGTFSDAIARVLNSAVQSTLEMHHLDQLDRRLVAKRLFVSGAIDALRIAASLCDDNRLPLVVAVAFDLKWGNEPRGVNFRTLSGFKRQLWESPPELIAVHEARTDVFEWIHDAPEVDATLFGIPHTRVFLREWLNEPTGEFPRHLWIISRGFAQTNRGEGRVFPSCSVSGCG